MSLSKNIDFSESNFAFPLLVFTFAAILLLTTFSSATASKEQPRFMHVTDIHLNTSDPIWANVDPGKTVYEFEKTRKKAAEAEVDFVVMTGDLVDWSHEADWGKKEGWLGLPYWGIKTHWKHWEKFEDIWDQFGVSTFAVVGNHGYYEGYYLDDEDEALDYFKNKIAPDFPEEVEIIGAGNAGGKNFEWGPSHKSDWSFDYGPIHVVGLDTGHDDDFYGDLGLTYDFPWVVEGVFTPPGGSGLTGAQIDWLESDLVGEENIYIFMHHPFLRNDGDLIDGNTTSCITSHRDEFGDVLKNYDVEAVYSGHTHSRENLELHGVELYQTGASYHGDFRIGSHTNFKYAGDTQCEYGEIADFIVEIGEGYDELWDEETSTQGLATFFLGKGQMNTTWEEIEGLGGYAKKSLRIFKRPGTYVLKASHEDMSVDRSFQVKKDDDLTIDLKQRHLEEEFGQTLHTYGEVDNVSQHEKIFIKVYLHSANSKPSFSDLEGNKTIELQLVDSSGKLCQSETTSVAVLGEGGGAVSNENFKITCPPGDYTLSAYFYGDENHESCWTEESLTVTQGATLSYVGDTSADYNEAGIILQAELKVGDEGLSGESIQFELYDDSNNLVDFWSDSTDEGGTASTSVTMDYPSGEYTIEAKFGDTTSSKSFTISPAETNLEYIGDTQGQYSDQLTVKAELKETHLHPISDMALSDKDVDFEIFETVQAAEGTKKVKIGSWNATTDESGVAVRKVPLDISQGSYLLQASFAGDENHGASSVQEELTVTPEDLQVSYTGPLEGNEGDTVTLTAELGEYDGEIGDLGGKWVNFHLGSNSWHAETNDVGIASKTVTLTQNLGHYTVYAEFQGDSYYEAASSEEKTFEIMEENVKEGTSLTYTGDTSGRYGDNVPLRAHLEEEDGGIPSSGKEIVFYLGSESWTAYTNEDGVAEIEDNLIQKPDDYLLTVEFNGDQDYEASDDRTSFSLEKGITTLVYAGDDSGYSGENISLWAQLMEDDGTPFTGQISDKPITFELNGDSWTAYTNEYGVAEKTVLLEKSGGRYTMTAKFWGDDYYENSSDSTSFSVSS